MTEAISKAVALLPVLSIEFEYIYQYAPPFKDGEGPQISKKTLQTLIEALSDLQGVAEGRDVIVPVDVIRFLRGEGPLEGKWFGDPGPFGISRPYWWRHHLSEIDVISKAQEK